MFSIKIDVCIILKMKLSVNEAKRTHSWARNWAIDFKIFLRPLVTWLKPRLVALTRVYVPTNFQKSSLDVGGRSVKDHLLLYSCSQPFFFNTSIKIDS